MKFYSYLISINNQGFVYMMSNKKDGTIYIGSTRDLIKRIGEHTLRVGSLFTKKY